MGRWWPKLESEFDIVTDHPDGPRTPWTTVRDSVPLTAQTVARGLALEAGRHPTLTELRAALGLDLDSAGAFEAARRVRLPDDDSASDELLAHFLDEMYRVLAARHLPRGGRPRGVQPRPE